MDIQITKSDGTTQTVTGVSATINPTAVIPPEPPSNIPLVMGTKISQGQAGQYRFGLNVHNNSGAAGQIKQLGGDVMRMTPFFRGYAPDWPGGNAGETVILNEAKAAIANGMVPYMTVTNWWANQGNDAGWQAFVKQVVTKTGCTRIECENEPNTHSPVDYAHVLAITYQAAKQANPNCRVSGPTTNANYVAATKTFHQTLMAQPNFWNTIDDWSFHSYNQTPENSWKTDCEDVVNRVLAKMPAGKDLRFINSEYGWVTSRAGEGAGDPSEGYSKTPFMRRATRRFSHDIAYALYDDAFGDVGMINKPWTPIFSDAANRVKAATDAAMYNRESGTWYVRLNVPGGQELVCWTTGTPRNVTVVVDATSNVQMYSRMVGGTNGAISAHTGRQAITVPLQLKGRLIGGVGCSFPEFN
jgi:hypothetical protein